MGLPVIFLGLLLLQSALTNADDSPDGFDVFSPEDNSDFESYLDRQARGGDKFLRFGKAFWDYDSGNDASYEDKDVPQPSRTGRQEKNDHFLRFGRNKQNLLRLSGNPQHRTARDKSSFLRFGRSIHDDIKKKRNKRAAVSSSEALKRHENYLRFGRSSNSNFMRFGRNFAIPTHGHSLEEEIMKRNFDSRNKHVLNYLRNLFRQSEGDVRHTNEI